MSRVQGLTMNKSPIEAMKVGDMLFNAMMKGHNLSPKIMLDANNKLKKNIKNETVERLYLCKSIIQKAVPIMYKNKHGNNVDPVDIEKIAEAFPWWYLDSFEDIWNEE